MKLTKKNITLFILLLFGSMCYSQGIQMKNSIMGAQFYQNGQKITLKQLSTITQSNEKSYQFIKIGKTHNTFAMILAGAGGFLIGYPLGQALGGGDANWELAGIGAGVVATSIPFTIMSNKSFRKGIDVHNAFLPKSSRILEFKVHLNNNGLGFAMNF